VVTHFKIQTWQDGATLLSSLAKTASPLLRPQKFYCATFVKESLHISNRLTVGQVDYVA
jgi:hypothetical protein